MLNSQRLDVYQRAIEFSALTVDIVDDLPNGKRSRGEQLERSSESVLRNIGEGAGRWSAADSAKHCKIARGEAMECVASLDIIRLRRLVSANAMNAGFSYSKPSSRCSRRWCESRSTPTVAIRST